MKTKWMLFLLGTLFCGVLWAKDFVLYKNGKAQAVLEIVDLNKQSAKEQKNAQSYLAHFNMSIRKCKLPPLTMVTAPAKNQKKIRIQFIHAKITDRDAYQWEFPDANTMKLVVTSSSIKYAVDDILERYFGVRYLLHTPHWLKPPKGYDRSIEYIYPAKKDVVIPRKKVAEKPDLNLKRYYSGDIPKEWRVKPGFPGMHGMGLYPFPASKYAPDNSWPKEILPIINGKRYQMPKFKFDPRKSNNKFYMRVARYMPYMGNWQPCFSNPKSVDIAVANILELMEKEPVDPLYGERYNINLDVNDNGGNCECTKCLAAIRGKKYYFGPNYSDLYWAWVNKVAERVTKKYPDLYFNCLAYREVTTPPSFKLHPNVIPMICRELNAGSCPKEKKKIEALFKSWKGKASVVFLWDYSYGSKYYVFPRIFFNVHTEMMRMAYRNNVRGIYCESNDRISMCGPNTYMIAQTMWNVNVDVNALLKQWCIDAVGKEAAPELEAYYKFWENYWLRPEVRKTNFFNSASNIYMTLGDSGSYTYAIRKGELAQLRKKLENVVRKAKTPDQKARAKHFLNVFSISEDAAKCLYSEFIEPEGFVKDADQAVALLRSIPEALKALDRLKKNPLVTTPTLESKYLQVLIVGVGNLRPIEKVLKDPRVRKELKAMTNNKALPPELRAQAKVMLGETFENKMKHGSLEKRAIRNTLEQIYRGSFNTQFVSHGKYSFGGINPLVRETVKGDLVYGKKYMILADVYAAKNSAEGVIHFLTNPKTTRQNTNYILLSNLKLNKGWQTISNVITLTGNRAGEKASQIFIQIWATKFEKDEPIYYDNIRVYQLD